MRWLGVACVVLVLTAPAWGWSKAGHMVTGAICYQVMQADYPAELARVVAILRAHPQFEKLWQPQIRALLKVDPTANVDQYLFMLAARWADDIRGDATYDRPSWHYINFPVVPAGTPATIVPRPPDPEQNIVKAFTENREFARTGPEDVDRAVPVCWLFHLVGDVHMPLHSVALFNETFPQGDRGGTRFYVRVRADSEPINLHYLWDGLITNTERYREGQNLAIALRRRPEFAIEKLPELSEKTFENWAKIEAVALAESTVYREGTLKGGPTPETAQVLPADYPRTVKPIAERQAVLAGRRLAAVLADVVEP